MSSCLCNGICQIVSFKTIITGLIPLSSVPKICNEHYLLFGLAFTTSRTLPKWTSLGGGLSCDEPSGPSTNQRQCVTSSIYTRMATYTSGYYEKSFRDNEKRDLPSEVALARGSHSQYLDFEPENTVFQTLCMCPLDIWRYYFSNITTKD